MQIQPNIQKPNADGHDNGAMNALSATASHVGRDVSAEFHNFLADMEDLVTKTTHLTGDDLDQARKQILKRVESAKELAEDVGGAIEYRTRKSIRATDHYVHEQPWSAIGIGAAAGLLVGMLISRRG